MAWIGGDTREEEEGGGGEEGADLLRYIGLESVSVRGEIGFPPCCRRAEAAAIVVLEMRFATLLLMWKIALLGRACLRSLFSSLLSALSTANSLLDK